MTTIESREIPFPADEYRERLSKVQSVLRDRNLHGLLVHTPENIYYLCGYQTLGYFAYQVLFVPCEGDQWILVREREWPNVYYYSWLPQDRQEMYRDIEDPLEMTVRILTRDAWADKRLGIEKNTWFLTIKQFEQLSSLLPRATLVDCSNVIDSIRLVKSPREIAYVRKAADLAVVGMRAAMDALSEGCTENEVAAAIHGAEIRNGCEYTGMPHFMGSGPRARLGHPAWSERRIEKGDPIFFELSGCVKRYHAAIMRTATIGPPSADVQRAMDVLIRTQDDAIRLMKAGVPASEVDAACRQPVLNAGLRRAYHQRVGYSIGIGFPPRWGEWAARDFMAEDTWVLEAGMIFHMVLQAEQLRISDTVLVTESGPDTLTRFDRILFVR